MYHGSESEDEEEGDDEDGEPIEEDEFYEAVITPPPGGEEGGAVVAEGEDLPDLSHLTPTQWRNLVALVRDTSYPFCSVLVCLWHHCVIIVFCVFVCFMLVVLFVHFICAQDIFACIICVNIIDCFKIPSPHHCSICRQLDSCEYVFLFVNLFNKCKLLIAVSFQKEILYQYMPLF